MTILIDSNIIIAYFNERDTCHRKALSIIQKIVNDEHTEPVISNYIFSEIVTVLSMKDNHLKAITLGEFLIKNVYIIDIDNKIFNFSWKIFKENKNLSFTDCTNLAVMKEFGINKIATFDKEFLKIKDIEIIN